MLKHFTSSTIYVKNKITYSTKRVNKAYRFSTILTAYSLTNGKIYEQKFKRMNYTELIASEESFLLSMGDPKNAIKSLILVVEQFCIKHFLILFQF